MVPYAPPTIRVDVADSGERFDQNRLPMIQCSMSPTIDQIRDLLSQLECEIQDVSTLAKRSLVTGLELPDIIRDVVDYLFPELRPYEAAIYMHMLRHSIVETGTQLLRVSRRNLTSGVIKSSYAGSRSGGGEVDVQESSYGTMRKTLEGLESIGAIRREGEPNREGTLYRVLLPEEIEVCRRNREKLTTNKIQSPIDEAKEADYYNVRENRLKIYERDNYLCRYCTKQLTRFTATLDHVHPVAEGGDNSFNNLVTACLNCNSKKNVRPLGDYLAENATS